MEAWLVAYIAGGLCLLMGASVSVAAAVIIAAAVAAFLAFAWITK